MSDRIILHVDCNCFYASVEMLYHPELAGKPLAVGGDPEERHGIVLTANYIAKRQGVKTGMALWQARQCCPDLVFVPPRMYLYLRFSRMARAIYQEYSEQVESFGLDECWIDLTDSCALLGDHTRSIENGYRIAQEISARIRRELGITVSIGVSWNKIYAKLGSDYKKPDAITVFDRNNYKQMIYSLPVSDLLYVGRRTKKKLEKYGIRTIGELAEADPYYLQNWFGKIGLMLSVFARGEDQTPVNDLGVEAPVKSVGIRELLCINIEADKRQRRRRELGDPGVRIRKSGYADPTADAAVERIMLLDAIETGNLDQEVKNTECPEEYRLEAVTIARMKEDYLVVRACMKILPREKAHLLENYYACKMNAEMIKGQDYFNPSFYTKIYRIRRQVRDTAEKTLQSKYGRQTWKKDR